MTWIPLLLTDPSPCLRYLVLKDLLKKTTEDLELRQLTKSRETDPLVSVLLNLQKSNGSWDSEGILFSRAGDDIQTTSLALQRLGYLGFDKDFPSVKKAAEFLFSRQREDGAWPMHGKKILKDEETEYQMMPIQTAIPLLGLAMCGYATDKRAEKAYKWLLDQRLKDGAWPVGIASGNYGGIAGYRRLAHSQWGCRSNTTTVLSCLAYHPNRRTSSEAQRALDLILGTKTMLRYNLGFYIARIIGFEKTIGRVTFMAKYDIAHILDLCWRVGASREDKRIEEYLVFIKNEQGKYGLWEYLSHHLATRWLTFDLLRSLSLLEENNNWISFEPKTPFQAYSKKLKRY